MPSRKRQSTMYVFPPSSLCNCRWLLNWTNLFRTRRRARKAQTAVAVTAMTTTSKIPPSLPTPRPFPPCITTLQVDLVYIPYNSLASSLFFSVSINALPRLSSLIIRLCFVFLFYSFFFTLLLWGLFCSRSFIPQTFKPIQMADAAAADTTSNLKPN